LGRQEVPSHAVGADMRPAGTRRLADARMVGWKLDG
jgi:hypothetical protein